MVKGSNKKKCFLVEICSKIIKKLFCNNIELLQTHFFLLGFTMGGSQVSLNRTIDPQTKLAYYALLLYKLRDNLSINFDDIES